MSPFEKDSTMSFNEDVGTVTTATTTTATPSNNNHHNNQDSNNIPAGKKKKKKKTPGSARRKRRRERERQRKLSLENNHQKDEQRSLQQNQQQKQNKEQKDCTNTITNDKSDKIVTSTKQVSSSKASNDDNDDDVQVDKLCSAKQSDKNERMNLMKNKNRSEKVSPNTTTEGERDNSIPAIPTNESSSKKQNNKTSTSNINSKTNQQISSTSSDSLLQTKKANLLLQFVYPKCKKSHAIKPYTPTKLRTQQQQKQQQLDPNEENTLHDVNENKKKATLLGIVDESIEDIFSLPKRKQLLTNQDNKSNNGKDIQDDETAKINQTIEDSKHDVESDDEDTLTKKKQAVTNEEDSSDNNSNTNATALDDETTDNEQKSNVSKNDEVSEVENEDSAKEHNYDGDDEIESTVVSDSMDESSKLSEVRTPQTMSSFTSKSESTSSSSASSKSSTSSSSTATTSNSSSSIHSSNGSNELSSESSPNKHTNQRELHHIKNESLSSQFDEETNTVLHPEQSDSTSKNQSSPPLTKTNEHHKHTEVAMSGDTSSSQKARVNPMRNRSMSEDSSYDQMKSHLSGVSVEMAMKDKHGRRPRCNSTDGELNLPRRGLCDEQKVMAFHKWDMDQFLPFPPRGFHNLGNTCFLNATLQCLAHLPTFCQCIANINDPSQQNGNGSKLNGHKGKLSNGQMITLALRSLLQRVHGLNGEAAPKQSPISPKAIVNRISLIDGTNRGYKFRPGRQEDAHEFLVHLLDAMNDGELKAAGINQKKSGWRDKLPIPRLDETTFVHRMFGGYLRSQVSCTKCGYNSNTYDPFLDLSLEVSSKKVNSVYSALKEYTRKETLDVANKWKCSGCNKRVCATKQLTCFRPPLSLCIQLKRFSFGGGMGGLMHHQYGYSHFAGKGMGMWRGGSKIQKAIEFPVDLKLPLSDGRKCEYILTGVIIHVGHSATSGHYTAFIRRQMKTGSQWYHMDDSYVEPVKEKTVLRQRDAYVLFYCRKEVKLNLPTPPSIYASAEEAIQSRQRSKSYENESALKAQASQSQFVQKKETTPDKEDITSTAMEENPNVNENKKQTQPILQKQDKKNTLSLDLGSKRGAVQVLLRKGKNKKAAWKPTHLKGHEDESGLLGNTKLSKWDEEDDQYKEDSSFREAALRELKREEKSRKRKMYLDSWDAGLDKGKTKKVKQKNSNDFNLQLGPKQNQFHRIQNNMMHKNRRGHNSPFHKKKRKRK